MRLAERKRYGACIEGLAAGFHPAATGPKEASDGNHYLCDPARPGKYLPGGVVIAVLKGCLVVSAMRR
jgi:hypothetical protein